LGLIFLVLSRYRDGFIDTPFSICRGEIHLVGLG